MPPTVRVGAPAQPKTPTPVPTAETRPSDPRPYASHGTPTPVPVAEPKKVVRSTPSTFMEDLDDTPLGARPEVHPVRPVAPVTPLPPARPDEPETGIERRDVLDDDLDGDLENKFEGFEARDESKPADPKRAADDLRAALES